MPDHRKHRGPHSRDRELFSVAARAGLRLATYDLSWLLTKGYAINSALKLVGDRYALEARQRTAVTRCTCSDDSLSYIQTHEVGAEQLSDRTVEIVISADSKILTQAERWFNLCKPAIEMRVQAAWIVDLSGAS